MLTTVSPTKQPQFTALLLTSVSMGTLKTRLEEALRHGHVERAELVSVVKQYGGTISRAAVGKWFSGQTTEMKAEHVFAVARRCRVNPEWLAMGKGPMERTAVAYIEAPPSSLVQSLGKLPSVVSEPLQALVEGLAKVLHAG